MAQISWTYNVTDSADDSALEGVNIWVTSDLEGLVVLDTGTTDSSGDVTLTLEEDTDVFIWHSLSGYDFSDNQPNSQTVTDGETGSGTGKALVAAVPAAVRADVTVLDLITDSFSEIGILGEGVELRIEDAKIGLRRLNKMIEQWRISRRLVYQIDIDTYTLTADATSHTIGPSGDFLAQRPTRITKANLIDTDQDPEVHLPISIIETAEEWGKIYAPLVASSRPSHLYCEYSFPDATLYLYPYPDTAYDLELFTWNQLDKFTALTQVLSLPEGYYEALMYSLAEKLCAPYGVPYETRMMISRDASRARALVKSHNLKAPKISTIDCGIPTIN